MAARRKPRKPGGRRLSLATKKKISLSLARKLGPTRGYDEYEPVGDQPGKGKKSTTSKNSGGGKGGNTSPSTSGGGSKKPPKPPTGNRTRNASDDGGDDFDRHVNEAMNMAHQGRNNDRGNSRNQTRPTRESNRKRRQTPPNEVEGGGRQAAPDFLLPDSIRKEKGYQDDLTQLRNLVASGQVSPRDFVKRYEAKRRAAQRDQGLDPEGGGYGRNRAAQREEVRMRTIGQDAGLLDENGQPTEQARPNQGHDRGPETGGTTPETAEQPAARPNPQDGDSTPQTGAQRDRGEDTNVGTRAAARAGRRLNKARDRITRAQRAHRRAVERHPGQDNTATLRRVHEAERAELAARRRAAQANGQDTSEFRELRRNLQTKQDREYLQEKARQENAVSRGATRGGQARPRMAQRVGNTPAPRDRDPVIRDVEDLELSEADDTLPDTPNNRDRDTTPEAPQAPEAPRERDRDRGPSGTDTETMPAQQPAQDRDQPTDTPDLDGARREAEARAILEMRGQNTDDWDAPSDEVQRLMPEARERVRRQAEQRSAELDTRHTREAEARAALEQRGVDTSDWEEPSRAVAQRLDSARDRVRAQEREARAQRRQRARQNEREALDTALGAETDDQRANRRRQLAGHDDVDLHAEAAEIRRAWGDQLHNGFDRDGYDWPDQADMDEAAFSADRRQYRNILNELDDRERDYAEAPALLRSRRAEQADVDEDAAYSDEALAALEANRRASEDTATAGPDPSLERRDRERTTTGPERETREAQRQRRAYFEGMDDSDIDMEIQRLRDRWGDEINNPNAVQDNALQQEYFNADYRRHRDLLAEMDDRRRDYEQRPARNTKQSSEADDNADAYTPEALDQVAQQREADQFGHDRDSLIASADGDFEQLEAMERNQNLSPQMREAIGAELDRMDPFRQGGSMEPILREGTLNQAKKKLRDLGLDNWDEDDLRDRMALAGNNRKEIYSNSTAYRNAFEDWQRDLMRGEDQGGGSVDLRNQVGNSVFNAGIDTPQTAQNLPEELRYHLASNVGFLPNEANFRRDRRGEPLIEYGEDTLRERSRMGGRAPRRSKEDRLRDDIRRARQATQGGDRAATADDSQPERGRDADSTQGGDRAATVDAPKPDPKLEPAKAGATASGTGEGKGLIEKAAERSGVPTPGTKTARKTTRKATAKADKPKPKPEKKPEGMTEEQRKKELERIEASQREWSQNEATYDGDEDPATKERLRRQRNKRKTSKPKGEKGAKEKAEDKREAAKKEPKKATPKVDKEKQADDLAYGEVAEALKTSTGKWKAKPNLKNLSDDQLERAAKVNNRMREQSGDTEDTMRMEVAIGEEQHRRTAPPAHKPGQPFTDAHLKDGEKTGGDIGTHAIRTGSKGDIQISATSGEDKYTVKRTIPTGGGRSKTRTRQASTLDEARAIAATWDTPDERKKMEKQAKDEAKADAAKRPPATPQRATEATPAKSPLDEQREQYIAEEKNISERIKNTESIRDDAIAAYDKAVADNPDGNHDNLAQAVDRADEDWRKSLNDYADLHDDLDPEDFPDPLEFESRAYSARAAADAMGADGTGRVAAEKARQAARTPRLDGSNGMGGTRDSATPAPEDVRGGGIPNDRLPEFVGRRVYGKLDSDPQDAPAQWRRMVDVDTNDDGHAPVYEVDGQRVQGTRTLPSGNTHVEIQDGDNTRTTDLGQGYQIEEFVFDDDTPNLTGQNGLTPDTPAEPATPDVPGGDLVREGRTAIHHEDLPRTKSGSLSSRGRDMVRQHAEALSNEDLATAYAEARDDYNTDRGGRIAAARNAYRQELDNRRLVRHDGSGNPVLDRFATEPVKWGEGGERAAFSYPDPDSRERSLNASAAHYSDVLQRQGMSKEDADARVESERKAHPQDPMHEAPAAPAGDEDAVIERVRSGELRSTDEAISEAMQPYREAGDMSGARAFMDRVLAAERDHDRAPWREMGDKELIDTWLSRRRGEGAPERFQDRRLDGAQSFSARMRGAQSDETPEYRDWDAQNRHIGDVLRERGLAEVNEGQELTLTKTGADTLHGRKDERPDMHAPAQPEVRRNVVTGQPADYGRTPTPEEQARVDDLREKVAQAFDDVYQMPREKKREARERRERYTKELQEASEGLDVRTEAQRRLHEAQESYQPTLAERDPDNPGMYFNELGGWDEPTGWRVADMAQRHDEQPLDLIHVDSNGDVIHINGVANAYKNGNADITGTNLTTGGEWKKKVREGQILQARPRMSDNSSPQQRLAREDAKAKYGERYSRNPDPQDQIRAEMAAHWINRNPDATQVPRFTQQQVDDYAREQTERRMAQQRNPHPELSVLDDGEYKGAHGDYHDRSARRSGDTIYGPADGIHIESHGDQLTDPDVRVEHGSRLMKVNQVNQYSYGYRLDGEYEDGTEVKYKIEADMPSLARVKVRRPMRYDNGENMTPEDAQEIMTARDRMYRVLDLPYSDSDPAYSIYRQNVQRDTAAVEEAVKAKRPAGRTPEATPEPETVDEAPSFADEPDTPARSLSGTTGLPTPEPETVHTSHDGHRIVKDGNQHVVYTPDGQEFSRVRRMSTEADVSERTGKDFGGTEGHGEKVNKPATPGAPEKSPRRRLAEHLADPEVKKRIRAKITQYENSDLPKDTSRASAVHDIAAELGIGDDKRAPMDAWQDEFNWARISRMKNPDRIEEALGDLVDADTPDAPEPRRNRDADRAPTVPTNNGHTQGQPFTGDHLQDGESLTDSGSIRRGDFSIVPTDDGYKVMQQFDSHRLSRKTYKTPDEARADIDTQQARRDAERGDANSDSPTEQFPDLAMMSEGQLRLVANGTGPKAEAAEQLLVDRGVLRRVSPDEMQGMSQDDLNAYSASAKVAPSSRQAMKDLWTTRSQAERRQEAGSTTTAVADRPRVNAETVYTPDNAHDLPEKQELTKADLKPGDYVRLEGTQGQAIAQVQRANDKSITTTTGEKLPYGNLAHKLPANKVVELMEARGGNFMGPDDAEAMRRAQSELAGNPAPKKPRRPKIGQELTPAQTLQSVLDATAKPSATTPTQIDHIQIVGKDNDFRAKATDRFKMVSHDLPQFVGDDIDISLNPAATRRLIGQFHKNEPVHVSRNDDGSYTFTQGDVSEIVDPGEQYPVNVDRLLPEVTQDATVDTAELNKIVARAKKDVGKLRGDQRQMRFTVPEDGPIEVEWRVDGEPQKATIPFEGDMEPMTFAMNPDTLESLIRHNADRQTVIKANTERPASRPFQFNPADTDMVNLLMPVRLPE